MHDCISPFGIYKTKLYLYVFEVQRDYTEEKLIPEKFYSISNSLM